MTPTSTTSTTRWSDATNANNANTTNIANDNNNVNRQQAKMLAKRRQLSGYESSSPEDNCEDEEVDETFVALQKLLKALNRNARQSTQVVPSANASSVGDQVHASNHRAMVIATSDDGAGITTDDEELLPEDEQRLSQEEILESRRQERERFRHMLFSKPPRPRSRQTASYQQSEEEEDDDEPVSSVESTISNRVISGSFSRLNVHVISRDRWAREEVERLPLVLLPENGRVVSPAENPKLNVCFTQEFMELHDDLMSHLHDLPEMNDHSRLLTPPQSTWYMQMRGMDGIHC